jgi:ankyrin repeat protein
MLLCGRAQGGKTPLHHAAIHGHMEVVRLLLERGANLEAKGDVRAHAP